MLVVLLVCVCVCVCACVCYVVAGVDGTAPRLRSVDQQHFCVKDAVDGVGSERLRHPIFDLRRHLNM